MTQIEFSGAENSRRMRKGVRDAIRQAKKSASKKAIPNAGIAANNDDAGQEDVNTGRESRTPAKPVLLTARLNDESES